MGHSNTRGPGLKPGRPGDDHTGCPPRARPSQEVPLANHSDWKQLDTAGFGVTMLRSVRRTAWIGTLVGTVAAVCGFAAGLLPLAIVGVVLLGAGVWNLRRPSVTGMVVDSAAMILTGVFNCLGWAWIEGESSTSAGKWILAGVIQIVWGVRRLTLYPLARFAAADRQAIADLESMVRELSKRNARTDPSVVEFSTSPIHGRRNRLGLYPEGVIGLLEHQAVRLERRGDIWIETRGTTLRGRSVKVRIQMSDLELKGRMSVEHFERFERWKLGQSQPRPAAA